jgi:hypothetical protein
METVVQKYEPRVQCVDAGKVYTVRTVGGQLINVVFYHKDEFSGEMVDGITSEELVEVLLHRHRGFMEKVHTTENLNTYTMIMQVREALKQRRRNKVKRDKLKKS